MIAHRLLAEGQTVRNFVVIITLADERQHLMFPFGQFGEETLWCIGAQLAKKVASLRAMVGLKSASPLATAARNISS